MPPVPPPGASGLPPHLQQLFNAPKLPFTKPGGNQYGPFFNKATVGKGSLIKFNYVGIPGKSVIHDAHPVTIIYSMKGDLVKGVNIRYLTFPYIKSLLGGKGLPNCDNPNISYNNIKGDKYITNAFRSYKRQGIKALRKLDCNFLLKVLGEMRSFNPNEVEQMRTYVRDALRNLNQPRATGGAKSYTDWLSTNMPNYKAGGNQPPNMIEN